MPIKNIILLLSAPLVADRNGLKRNIRILYALAFFQTFMLISPVLVPFFESLGLSLSEIFYLQAIYASVIVLLEAPSGYLADRFGRRAVLLIGSIANGAGYAWLVFADGFMGLIIFEMILGVAISMMSGADLALLYDSERALRENEGEDNGNSIAHMSSTKAFANGAGALLGGAMAMWSFDAIVLAQAAVSWICLLLALVLVEPADSDGESVSTRLNVGDIYRHVMKGDPVLRQVFFAIPVYNLFTFLVIWLVQPYWESRGLSLFVFGMLVIPSRDSATRWSTAAWAPAWPWRSDSPRWNCVSVTRCSTCDGSPTPRSPPAPRPSPWCSSPSTASSSSTCSSSRSPWATAHWAPRWH